MTADEQRLRDALDGAPSAPPVPGFGDSVVKAARRRRTTRQTAIAAGAVVLCVPVVAGLLSLRPDDRAGLPVAPPTASQTSTSVKPPSAQTALDCDRPPAAPVAGDPVVPDGAVAARMCGGLIDNGGFNAEWPSDTLTGEYVDQLVARLNRLKPYEEPDGCTLPYSTPFDLVLRYPDGSKVWVHGDTSGTCENVAVDGGDVWSGAPGVRDSVREIVRQQRRETTSVGDLEAPTCPDSWQDVSATIGADKVSPGDPVAVTACRYTLEQQDPKLTTQSSDGVLDKQVVADNANALVRLAADGSRSDPCGGGDYDLDRTQDVLLVRDSAGDVHVVSTVSCWPSELTGPRLYPSDALASAVDSLFD
jgi:hypothetical protein